MREEKINEIGKIGFEFDKKQLGDIANAGKLGDFVEKATSLFRQNLKAELVNSASSGSTSFARYDDWEFGTVGPIPPNWPLFEELESIVSRIKNIEVLVNLNNLKELSQGRR
ncbi:MAG: hypothetical protein GY931_17920 [Maribacter sp.]|nr:hypothetical protein [Maribacter sp.]